MIDLVYNKKINAKNAFDIKIENLDSLTNVVERKNEDSWQWVSNGLAAFAQVYSYRVDAVYNDTFKILGNMNRSNDDNELGVVEKQQNKRKPTKNIETDPKKLELKEFDLGFQVDPLFKHTTAMFSQINAKGLLSYCLDLDKKLNLVLEGEIAVVNPILENDISPVNSPNLKVKPSLLKSNAFNTYLRDLQNNIDYENSDLCVPLESYKNDYPRDTHYHEDKHNNLKSSGTKSKVTEDRYFTQFQNEIGRTKFVSNFNNRPDSQHSDQFNNNNDASKTFRDVFMEDKIVDQGMYDEIQVDDLISMNSQEPISDPKDGNYNYENDRDNNIQISNFGNIKMTDPTNNLSIFSLKANDIKSHIQLIGIGGQEAFNPMINISHREKSTWEIPRGAVKAEKTKKVQKLFEFIEEKEIDTEILFPKKDKKNKKRPKTKVQQAKNQRRRVNQMLNYRKLFLFSLNTNSDFIFAVEKQDINADEELENQENDIRRVDNVYTQLADNVGSGQFEDEPYEELKNTDGFNIPMTQQYGTDIKSVGIMTTESKRERIQKLYKVVDVRKVKSNMWDTIQKKHVIERSDRSNLDFSTLVTNVNTGNTQNVNSATCFVCLLHLCNEKGKQTYFILRAFPQAGISQKLYDIKGIIISIKLIIFFK